MAQPLDGPSAGPARGTAGRGGGRGGSGGSGGGARRRRRRPAGPRRLRSGAAGTRCATWLAASAARWALRALRERGLARGQELIHPGQRLGAHRGLGGDLPDAALEPRQPLDGGVGRGLGRLRDRDDALLLVLGAAQEVELIEQVVEAVGVEDHRDDVGRRGLVLGDELGAQDPSGFGQRPAQLGQVIALARDLSLERGETCPVGGQRLADGGLALLHERDLRFQGADARVELADARRQAVLARLLGAEL